MRQRWMAVVCLLAGSMLAQEQKTGVLLLAHGGSAKQWNEEVRQVAERVDQRVPTEVAFGMATRSTIQAGVDRLTARGVTEIVAVPLFVSSHSSVVDSTAYLLGLRKDKPEDLKMFAAMDHGGRMKMDSIDHMKANANAERPVESKVPIRMTSALGRHAMVAAILMDRAVTISERPAEEVVVLVAHGPVSDEENALWLEDMKALAEAMKAKTKYAGIEYLTVRDDADEPVREVATKELRAKVETIEASGKKALVVPLLLSYGGIEDGLRKRLEGLDYRMPKQGLLPDARIAEWVVASEEAAK